MRHRFKRWWNVAPLWPICFCILFGKDVAKMDVDQPLELFQLLETFSDGGKATVVYAEMIPVIAGMLKAGVTTVVAEQAEEDEKRSVGDGPGSPRSPEKRHSRRRSLSVNDKSTFGGKVSISLLQ